MNTPQKVLLVDDGVGISEAVALLASVGYPVARYMPPREKAATFEIIRHERHQGAKERARRLKRQGGKI